MSNTKGAGLVAAVSEMWTGRLNSWFVEEIIRVVRNYLKPYERTSSEVALMDDTMLVSGDAILHMRARFRQERNELADEVTAMCRAGYDDMIDNVNHLKEAGDMLFWKLAELACQRVSRVGYTFHGTTFGLLMCNLTSPLYKIAVLMRSCYGKDVAKRMLEGDLTIDLEQTAEDISRFMANPTDLPLNPASSERCK